MNRLRAYRALEEISQDDLGKVLGLSAQMISAVEGGRRPFLGDLSVIGYSNARLELPDMSEPLHRHRATTKVATKRRAHELLRLAGEVFAELKSRVDGVPSLTIEPLPAPESLEDVEKLAVDVRYLVRHEPEGPIRNLTAVVERAGVCLVPVGKLDGIDGLSSWVNGVPVVGVNPNVPGDRFRHTLAHELAHLLCHVRKGETTEDEANRFAGAFLFPESEFDDQMPARPQLRDFVNLKSSWGVSVAALVYRAHELEYIDDRRYRALQIQMSKWRKSEPATFAPVHGELFSTTVAAAGGVDAVARNLGVNRSHLRDLNNWSHLRLA